MCEAVVQRQDDEHGGAEIDGDYGIALLYVCSIVAVGKEDTLGVCGGAGSVGNVCIIIRADALVACDELVLVGLEELIAHLLDFAHADFLLFELVIVEGGVVKDDDFLYVVAFGKDGPDLGKMVP